MIDSVSNNVKRHMGKHNLQVPSGFAVNDYLRQSNAIYLQSSRTKHVVTTLIEIQLSSV